MAKLYHICEHCGNETKYEHNPGARRGARTRVTTPDMDAVTKRKIYRERFNNKSREANASNES